MKPAAPRPAALAALAVVATVFLTACADEDDIRQQTQRFTTAGGGAHAEAGDIAVRNALLVADDDGDGSAVLVATLANRGDQDDQLVEVRVGAVSAPLDAGAIDIPADRYASLDGAEQRVQVTADEMVPGRVVPVTLVFGRAPAATVDVPVYAAEDRYADLGPTAVPPTAPTPDGTSPTPEPTATS